jgi:hypothetical protein
MLSKTLKNIKVIYLGMAVNYCHILTLEKVGFFIGQLKLKKCGKFKPQIKNSKIGNLNKKVGKIQNSFGIGIKYFFSKLQN